MDADVASFMSVTGVDSEQVARSYLAVAGGDSMQAIQLFFEEPDLQASFVGQASASTSAPAASSSRARTNPAGREDAQGVIHIDSDDDDVPMSGTEVGDPDDGDDDVAAVARAAQEEEDAAMARRLQDDMYSQDPGSIDGVRAPMARTTETLVAPDPSWSLDDDQEHAVMDQIRRRQQRDAASRGNPFTQSVWDRDDPVSHGAGAPPVASTSRLGGAPAAPSSRTQRLADLFRPPYDLIVPFSWEDARQEGKDEKKWIMVNFQDMSDFNCQALNRDHWKDESIRALVREHFIFLQYEKGDVRAQDYVNFYFSHGVEDPNNYPYVSLIDPRTGEQVKTWSGLPFPTPAEFHADLVEFLDRYSLAANSKNPVPKSKPKTKPVDYGRMTEDEMLEMALKNSLEGASGSSSSSSRPSAVQDPDELTKDVGKGKEVAVEEKASTPAPASPFAQISSANPHVEPANNPATTTRIQFRHPAGRIIRRFAMSDPVRRIYEWLKAEPLSGKEGLTFELKAVPNGGDLIEKLDQTIEEAGLKMGTVMIEFLEEDDG